MADTAQATRIAKLSFAAALVPLTIMVFRSEEGRLPLLGDIDLAIHEFGHMLFQPFGFMFAGETMMILGGSLVQIAFPLIFAAYFLRSRENAPRDLFAVGICVWWAALNILDVSIYVGDSRAGQLMLLFGETGEEGGPHDWRMLLSEWGVLHRDLVYAARLRALAAVVSFAAIVGAAWTAWFGKGKGEGSDPGV